jgi:hypothetical protein
MRPKTPGKKTTRGPTKFRKTETTRLFRAALDAGWGRVECDPVTGKIVASGKPDDVSGGDNPWDKRVLDAPEQKRSS